MAFELILLGALIFIFIVSFCGLLQKIKQTYERERILAERIARRREYERTQRISSESFSEIYINPSFATDEVREFQNGGIFPAAPPPYTQSYMEPPPKYDDVVKVHVVPPTPPAEIEVTTETIRPPRNRDASPPPYTITV